MFGPRTLDHVFGIGEKQLQVVALRRKIAALWANSEPQT